MLVALSDTVDSFIDTRYHSQGKRTLLPKLLKGTAWLRVEGRPARVEGLGHVSISWRF